MATFYKFNDFSEQLTKGVHHIGTDTFKLFLTNAAPTATNTILADIAQIDYANISGADAPVVTLAESETAGTTTVTGVSQTITATGVVPTFRYYGIYNDSAVSPDDALVCFWDHGTSVDLQAGETFSIKFNGATVGSAGNIITVA